VGLATAAYPVVLVVGITVSVTSIPIISRILHDLGILQTRF
jgi:Kef-type K+ transport system membrane component KefB